MSSDSYLTGSSGSEAEKIKRLTWWFKKPIEQHTFDPIDELDHLECMVLLKQVKKSTSLAPSSDPDSLVRFQDPVLVGLGAFGLIYSAVDLQADTTDVESVARVAIKFLRPSKKGNTVARKRFSSEAATLESTKHPNIVQVLEFGQVNELPYILIELADHGSLADYLEANRRPMPPRQAAWLVMKIAEALHAAHSSPLIHRDIKPGNILLRTARPDVSSEGLGLWPLLTDFGLAKDISNDDVRSKWTQVGEVLGTVRYMSPEQIRGETLKTQTDLFSLGIVLHELLSGENPFLAANDYETQENIVKNPPCPFDRRLRIPRQLQAIVQRCLSKASTDRYPSANAIAVDLNHYLEGKPVALVSPTTWDLLMQLVRLHPIPSTVLATVFLSSLITAALLNREWKTQRELAEDRKVINNLFFESIKAANTGINDTIVAGARVSQADLLQNLLRQIPLLEQALELNPTDRDVAINLQVMQHYAALCYLNLSDQAGSAERSEMQKQGLAVRQRSLDLIEVLLQNAKSRDPVAYQRRSRDRIVGEHWMAHAYHFDGQEPQRLEWLVRSIEHAQSYLREFPADLAVESLLQAHRTEKAVVLRKQSPAAAVQELEAVFRYYDSLRTDDGLDFDSTSHAIQALLAITQIHIENGDKTEVEKALERYRDFVRSNVVSRISNHWNWRDLWVKAMGELCRDLLNNQRWDPLAETSLYWQSEIESLADWSDTNTMSGLLHSRDSAALAASIFHMIALDHLGKTQEFASAKTRVAQLWKRCKTTAAFKNDAFVDSMLKLAVTKEDLERLLD
ncbi:MAG: serine/threonine-protein kinase [Planctomycetota bacterium]